MGQQAQTPVNFFLEIEKYIEEPTNEGATLKRFVEGYCVVAGNVDEQFDVIDEAALRGAIQYLQKYSTVLYNHDQNRPIGTVVDAKLVDDRIWVKVLISQYEDEIWQKILEKVLNSFSVSGLVEDFEYRTTRGGEQVRVIKKFRIYEISLVSVPANAEAKTLRAYLEKALEGVEPPATPELDPEIITKLNEEVCKNMDLKDKLAAVLKLISSLEEAVNDEKAKEILAKVSKELKDVLDSLGSNYPYPYPSPQPEKFLKPEDLEALKDEVSKMFDDKLTGELKEISERVEKLEQFQREQEEISKQLVEFFKEEYYGDLGEATGTSDE